VKGKRKTKVRLDVDTLERKRKSDQKIANTYLKFKERKREVKKVPTPTGGCTTTK